MADSRARYHPYPAYKPSGVPWLGAIPAHWEVMRLKQITNVSFSSVDKHSLENEIPVQLCNYVDVYKNEQITREIEFMRATASADEIKNFTLAKDDVLITKDSESWTDIAVPAHVEEDLENVLCGYHLALVRPNLKMVDGKFLFRAFQATTINYQFQVEATGITRYGIDQYAIANTIFPLSPLPEQRAIAAFLDRETARLDTLIAKKQQLIERLQEKRTALISRAVTKGLDANARMKDSGVEWLGEVPEGWEVRRLRFTVDGCQNGMWGDEPNGTIDDIICVRVADFDRVASKVRDVEFTLRAIPILQRRGRELKAGDLLLEKSGGGELQPVGKVVLYDLPHQAICSNFIARMRPLENYDARFLNYLFDAAYSGRLNVNSLKQNTGIQNLDSDSYLSECGAFPPLPEQRAIAAYLDRETARLDALVAKIQDAIERLREYRGALIAAAVTGKVDVRQDPKGF
jgi:type I restriction enzyme S subunit